jgi:hypothetical protein
LRFNPSKTGANLMKHQLFGAISLALTLAVASCEPAYAVDTVCDTPQKVSEGLISSSAKRGFTVALYDEVTDPALVVQFVTAFNETPPASNISADMVLVFAAKHTASGMEQPGRLAIYFNGGCQVPKAGMMMRDPDVEKILGPQA